MVERIRNYRDQDPDFQVTKSGNEKLTFATSSEIRLRNEIDA